ncbi:MAG TPA: ABC transporter ATP-binding protein [Gemmatimonadaceae bacterium]|nr:ABC transporter ATP-binding protein [Gemmatimonadaceae bacterium]
MRPVALGTLRRTLAVLRPHAAGERGVLAAGALLGLATVALHVARPWPLKWILDYLVGAATPGPVAGWVASAPAAGVLALSVLLVALSLAAAAAEWGQTILLNGLVNRVLFRFRAALFSHLLRQPLAFHESREVGELLTRIVYDTSRLRRGINGVLLRIVQTVALFAATIAVLLWVDVRLGIVFAGGGLVALGAMRRRGRRIARVARRQRKREGRLAALVERELSSVRELQAFGAGASAVCRRFGRKNDSSLRREQKVQRLAAGLTLGVEALLAVTLAVAIGLGTHAVLTGRLGAGDLVLFSSYALTLRGPFVDFARQTARLGRTAACAERLAALAEREPTVADRRDAVPAPALRGEISLERVSAKAPKRSRAGRKWALDSISCEIPAGRRTAVVGGNGAGKSTLLRLLLRIADPARGTVHLDGRDLREYEIDTVRRQMSVVLQDGVLAGLTVRENIGLGTPDADDAAIHAAAAAAGVDGLIARLPRGYDTPVRRGGTLLSGGERQRIAIARALLRDGRLWLLDEPTAGLDQEAAREVVEVLFRATAGHTTVWVTHDPALVTRFDWVLAFEEGGVTFAGPPSAYQGSVGPATDHPPTGAPGTLGGAAPTIIG